MHQYKAYYREVIKEYSIVIYLPARGSSSNLRGYPGKELNIRAIGDFLFENFDSANVSGCGFSADIHTDILDKPRLNSEVADCQRKVVNHADSAYHDDAIGVHY
ncbi:hypothetical protein CAEBREN_10463 [Caenorhabditis brenneri]|uniref:Uncharacterized protein n=1 Tax=Caenorhabditis brenneri TaxID=135651 RepID=G0N5X4_CAEBE|nr:hypothetical protein CAEBREN_10463 [Caenorhabditis brenneri]